ncbi:hypothetical protein HID58_031409 [Brassica napus]|uniref:BnaA04g29660D protein n=2 Tax=Brassica napus TaxID=3708 RepID=A0A078JES9_BRANA|nr:hypothetical protein HID58_092504 [Brassica napus]KAH0908088.1 hypothetical protein HID58_031409 [Brassica napus]CAF2305122.1 unnamed protein product [Brassica napus]CDY66098.1 BnaA04g29660D [Brassica napus]
MRMRWCLISLDDSSSAHPPISVAVLDSVECRRNRILLFLPPRRLLHSVVNKTAASNQPLPLGPPPELPLTNFWGPLFQPPTNP